MKKITAIITTLSITLSLFIFPVSATAATAVDITISVNEIRQIRVTPKEGFATKWRTSDRNVVIVSKTGKIKGIAEGKATITATAGKSTLKFNIIVKKAEEPVLLPDAPEIVFLLLLESERIEPYVEFDGLFIDNKGAIKEFSYRKELFRDDETGFYGYGYGVDFFINFVLYEYDEIIGSGKDTGQRVDRNTLEIYNNLLKEVDKNSRIMFYDDRKEVWKHGGLVGYASYYGIRKTPTEVEVILFKSRGNTKFDNTDPNAEEICQWLIKTIPFKKPFDYENWFDAYYKGW
ncbi:MAG: Ig-like domain-containing protein [Oscillospiraceae bacterium]|nr:Ig-like domain-containing protein [Oscillospiraceae bacterium]